MLAGQTLARTAHFALHSAELTVAPMPPDSKPLFASRDVWLGAMVPKRWARRAVTRNAIKRQVYVVGAGFAPTLAQAAHVVRLRSAFDKTRFVSASSVALKTAVRQELVQLFSKAAQHGAGAGAQEP